ncbi:glycerol-3-phosphate dehydrogenase/oxidase [Paeniglutamicibacter sp. ZC-3]|uniref:glycerol-3-phosphate dehydrogenase/oxidase n=1 Tax=Paeniglutamicibacter sp. ZC-3 TaxID=2986919 RepID=UPI0021F70403|nr:glycerol-3-phosphate dehydrogenase/oxidase [Paeniglutamicibacter sp. ZC-3]MCV9993615.1 glycerol-3-phosphate dehydrogenase/oxidase [Paeniglutamicibacter sp. ZC-3]
MEAAASHRSQLAALRARPGAKVLIVGGGINGVATFRYLALQGVDVALVERGDYCQGASGASSHMIHGGIRYLENGEFRLVHEAVRERNTLLEIAPHYVKPLRTTVPIFSTFSGLLAAPLRFVTHRPGLRAERGALLIKIGLVMYDLFAGAIGRNTPWHRFRGAKASLAVLPKLRTDVKYTATYFDASVHNPERLTLDVLRDGLEANPHARASNYVALIGHGERGAHLRDELTGEEFDFDAQVIVNATGAWVDQTNAVIGTPSRFMGGTKGSHIVLDHPGLLAACDGREIFFEHSDGRIVLIYPLGDRVLVGTTDIDADMGEPARCTDAEVAYFFELIGHVFPSIKVGEEQIVYRFSGVRPLPSHENTAPGFVSRDYRIEHSRLAGGTPMLCLVGGKWTTFRALGKTLGNKVLAELGVSPVPGNRMLPIGGGKDYPKTPAELEAWFAQRAALAPRARLEVLLQRYGTRADAVLEHIGPHDPTLPGCPELSAAEVRYLGTHEQVGTLADVFIRRTSLAFRGRVTESLLAQVAEALAPVLGWDAADTAAQVDDCRRVLTEEHGAHVALSNA